MDVGGRCCLVARYPRSIFAGAFLPWGLYGAQMAAVLSNRIRPALVIKMTILRPKET